METFLNRLRRALTGTGDLVLGTDRATLPAPLPGGVTIVVTTSGSTTGRGRPVGLTPQAVRASIDATHEFLGGPGQWLLTLPRDHIAGLQVCARSITAGYDPVIRGEESLAAAIARMDPTTRRYTSLVPTQLVRILAAIGADENGEPGANSGPGANADLAALASLDGILLGGAAIDPALLTRAREAGLQVHTTYGSTETAGGCVYDGEPLTGVKVRIADDGRIHLGGSTLAWGYLDEGPSDFFDGEDGRWLRTGDLGVISASGHLSVLGRADDIIITGGLNVHPAAVERAIRDVPAVADCVVVGLPSPEWGAEVAALVVPRETGVAGGALPERLLEEIRAVCRERLGAASAPRALALTMRLPTRGPGKVDRRGAADLTLTILAAGEGARLLHGNP